MISGPAGQEGLKFSRVFGRPGRIAGRLDIGRDFRAVGLLQDVIGEHEALASGDSAEVADLSERQPDKGIAVVDS